MKEVSKATASKSITKESYSPSLAKAMIRTFGPYYAFLGTFTFVEECFIRIFQPLFMGKKSLYIANFSKNLSLISFILLLILVTLSRMDDRILHPWLHNVPV